VLPPGGFVVLHRTLGADSTRVIAVEPHQP
jgi:hypothetical protein